MDTQRLVESLMQIKPLSWRRYFDRGSRETFQINGKRHSLGLNEAASAPGLSISSSIIVRSRYGERNLRDCNAMFGSFVFRRMGSCSLLLASGRLRDADAVLR
jgi:hypothetical protein